MLPWRQMSPKIQEILKVPGLYISFVPGTKNLFVPLFVNDQNKVFSMKIDKELDPEGFFPDIHLKGPLLPDD